MRRKFQEILWKFNIFSRRCGGIGRRKGLKIPRTRVRTGSSPVIGTRIWGKIFGFYPIFLPLGKNWGKDFGLFTSIFALFSSFSGLLPLFLLIFGIGALLSWIFCVIAYTILIYIQLLNDDIINTIHAVSNVYSLYVICGIYIGFQISILKDINE